MKVCIDAISLVGPPTGLERYVANLVNGLVAVASAHEYVVLMNSTGRLRIEDHGPRLRCIPVRTPAHLHLLWNQVSVPLLAAFRGFDVLHCAASAPPIAYPGRIVVTVHDLAFEHYPEGFSLPARLYWRKMFRFALSRADSVVCDSESTRGDVLERFNVPEDRVSVVYPFLELGNFLGGRDWNEVQKRYGLPEHYVLYVGALEPRKNLARLVEAFSIARRNGGLEHSLVLAGPNRLLGEPLQHVVQRWGLETKVLLPGVIDEEDLPTVYRKADLFTYVSLYEGFGYPPLEAMACGTPVVVSRAASLPEVAGDAALYVDPNDPEEIASSILQVLTDDRLAMELRGRGTRQARQFGVDRMVSGILSAYERAVRC